MNVVEVALLIYGSIIVVFGLFIVRQSKKVEDLMRARGYRAPPDNDTILLNILGELQPFRTTRYRLEPTYPDAEILLKANRYDGLLKRFYLMLFVGTFCFVLAGLFYL